MNIAVGLLAYNSERWIAESAGCLQPYVDNVYVLIDAATKDNTARILDEMQINHSERVWTHHYAAAKNHLLDQLDFWFKPDWYIILDDDEKLSPTAAKKLIDIIKTTDKDGIEIPMKQHYPYWATDEENFMVEFGFNPHISAFKKGYRYGNVVHESINVPMEKRLRFPELVEKDVFIHHHAWKGNRLKYEAAHHTYYQDLSFGSLNLKEGEHRW
ncbi:MAG TPA: glycosyltransferase [Patescibacteria group bacterium]